MKEIEERLNHIGELVKGLSEQNSGNMTILNSNCQMLGNRLEDLEKKVQDLETKTASELSQEVVVESATGEEQDCLWVARDKRGGRLYVYIEKPEEQYCETFTSTDEDEIYLRIDEKLFPQVTFENSPQKLMLESSISKTETVEDSSGSPEIPEDQSDGYVPTVDDFFYTPEKENSEKPNNQEFDKERALELVRDIENCTIDNANSATKAILLSCEELRKLLGNE